MTFFLNAPEDTPTIPANNPKADLPSWGDGLGAAISKSQLEYNSNFVAQRRKVAVKDTLATSIVPRIGMEQIRPFIEERNEKAREQGMLSQIVEMPETVEEAVSLLGPNFSEKAIELARQQAEANPEAWADVDLSEEAIDAQTNEILRAEYQDATDMLDLMGGGRMGAEFVGETAALVADVKTLPLFLLGGSGSLARVMAQEALIGAGSELAMLPSQFEMADRLEIEDPNVIEQLAFGATVGAGLGGVLHVGARGYQFLKGRNLTMPIGRMDQLDSEVMVDQAEDILTSNTADPFEQINKIIEQAGEAAKEPPYRLENPINPEQPPLVLGPDQRVTTERLDPVTPDSRPITDANLIETAQAGIDSADPDGNWMQSIASIESTAKKYGLKQSELDGKTFEQMVMAVEAARDADPVAKSAPIKEPKPKGKRPKSLKQFVVDEGGIWKGDDQGDIAALEYRKPGFVKKNQRVTSSAGDNGGGLRLDEMRQRAVEQGYLPEDATINDLIDALDSDIRGDARAYSQADAQSAAEWDAYDGISRDARQADPDAIYDYAAMTEIEGRFFVRSPADLDFADPSGAARAQREDEIARDVDDYFHDNGFKDVLNDAQQAEIIAALQERGGDPEYLIEQVFDREADFLEGRFDEAPEGYTPLEAADEIREAGRAAGNDIAEPKPDTAEAAVGGARAGGGEEAPRNAESTAAGQQTLIDGVSPITARDRLQAAQNAPLRGGNAAADDGLFDMGSRDQTDMFSDPSSPEAQKMHEITSNNMRDEIEADGNFDVEIETPNGSTVTISATDALDFLDEGDAFSARLDLCGMGPT